MMLNPRYDIAARTDLFSRASRLLLPQSILRDRPFQGDDYRRVLSFAHAVMAALHRWGWSPRDMIDVHSFLWVAVQSPADAAHAPDDTDA